MTVIHLPPYKKKISCQLADVFGKKTPNFHGNLIITSSFFRPKSNKKIPFVATLELSFGQVQLNQSRSNLYGLSLDKKQRIKKKGILLDTQLTFYWEVLLMTIQWFDHQICEWKPLKGCTSLVLKTVQGRGKATKHWLVARLGGRSKIKIASTYCYTMQS